MSKTYGDFWSGWRGPEQPELPLAHESIPPTSATDAPPLHPSTDTQGLSTGQHIVCDQPTGVFRPCLCGSTNYTIRDGVGPHRAQLICDGCGRGGRWLRQEYLEPADVIS
jgi:hypothetical protein